LNQMWFRDRVEAGKKLATQLGEYKEKLTVILAIPRGGVVVGYEVAKALNAPLDIIVPRKIGAPQNPELAIGAVTEDGTTILNQSLVHEIGVNPKHIEQEKENQIKEIRRRIATYRGVRPPVKLKGKTVILVDDGIATGATVRAAIHSIMNQGASEVVVAVPVAPPDAILALKKEVNKVLCLITREPFYAIGQFYEDFTQVSDDEVVKLLKESSAAYRQGAS